MVIINNESEHESGHGEVRENILLSEGILSDLVITLEETRALDNMWINKTQMQLLSDFNQSGKRVLLFRLGSFLVIYACFLPSPLPLYFQFIISIFHISSEEHYINDNNRIRELLPILYCLLQQEKEEVQTQVLEVIIQIAGISEGTNINLFQ